MTHKPQAVLWDMDGTLVDTEPYWMAAETALVESFGGTWSHEQALQLVGSGLHESAEILRAAGVDMDADAIVSHLTDAVRELLETQGVPFRPGARELLRDLQVAGIPSALVTMSLGRMARSVIDLIDFPAFDVVVPGDEVDYPKPHPEPYLKASRLLDIDIADALVIEDSPTGLRAGIASGAVTLGVPHIVPLDGLGAHALWPTLEGRTAGDIVDLYAAVTSVEVGR
ncbi:MULTISPECIES: HAD family phosphatase [unclassified Microbacterium]|uniref:HAD family hydrolase n=1 Tax=unclassified Microbacterium TaxID=2609290 RepID=UPI001E115403|nr:MULTISPECIES: HAD family phosphatase [unclassified Microbacterium]CAH0179016.1 Phosphorylated carbohydrates phosphatase TM_1254 [Microbacterium sp. Bi121]HWK77570.1 HAD family phosphatase [Microbacterium sp.]